MRWVNGGSRPAKSCWQRVTKNLHKGEGMLGINCIAQQEGQIPRLGHSVSTTLSPPQWGWRCSGGAEACRLDWQILGSVATVSALFRPHLPSRQPRRQGPLLNIFQKRKQRFRDYDHSPGADTGRTEAAGWYWVSYRVVLACLSSSNMI